MSMKTKELIREIEKIASPDLAETWDNCGMQINMGDETVERVLVVLEITGEVIKEAEANKVDFIITHHPLFFHRIKEVSYNDITGNYAIALIKSGISVYSAHTSFDSAVGGNNDYMAKLLGLDNVRNIPAADGENSIGCMGEWKEDCNLKQACGKVAQALPFANGLRAAGSPHMPISKVALCTGAGADFAKAAQQHGCQLFITGDVGYHAAQEARESGFCMIDAGHYGTEQIFAENFADLLKKSTENKIKIIESKIDLNPFSIYGTI